MVATAAAAAAADEPAENLEGRKLKAKRKKNDNTNQPLASYGFDWSAIFFSSLRSHNTIYYYDYRYIKNAATLQRWNHGRRLGSCWYENAKLRNDGRFYYPYDFCSSFSIFCFVFCIYLFPFGFTYDSVMSGRIYTAHCVWNRISLGAAGEQWSDGVRGGVGGGGI